MLEKICLTKIHVKRKCVLTSQEMECRSCDGYDKTCENYNPVERETESNPQLNYFNEKGDI